MSTLEFEKVDEGVKGKIERQNLKNQEIYRNNKITPELLHPLPLFCRLLIDLLVLFRILSQVSLLANYLVAFEKKRWKNIFANTYRYSKLFYDLKPLLLHCPFLPQDVTSP